MSSPLTTVIGGGPVSSQMKDGSVALPGFELSFVDVNPINRAFRRMTRDLEFDICEMALVTYFTARQYGIPVTAIPVFPGAQFVHGSIVLNRKLAQTPKDLEGQSIGVRAYTVTPGVWARAILEQEHSVDLDQISYILGDDEHVIEFNQDPEIWRNLSYRMGADLQQQLAEGEFACGLQVPPGDHKHLQPLYENPRAAGIAWFNRNNAIQLSHVICIRNDVLAANPELAIALVEAFANARARHLGDAGEPAFPYEDPMPIGFEQNRASLELLMHHAVNQHVLRRSLELTDIFVAH